MDLCLWVSVVRVWCVEGSVGLSECPCVGVSARACAYVCVCLCVCVGMGVGELGVSARVCGCGRGCVSVSGGCVWVPLSVGAWVSVWVFGVRL